MSIDTADVVFHKPTRETWLVACAHDGRVYWCGWPTGSAADRDCLLTYKATPVERYKLMLEIAESRTDDHRGRCAQERVLKVKEALDGVTP